MDFLTLIQILDSTIRLATPLLLACLAGLYSERAGIFDNPGPSFSCCKLWGQRNPSALAQSRPASSAIPRRVPIRAMSSSVRISGGQSATVS